MATTKKKKISSPSTSPNISTAEIESAVDNALKNPDGPKNQVILALWNKQQRLLAIINDAYKELHGGVLTNNRQKLNKAGIILSEVKKIK